jgi:nitrate/nitrite transporter NarK
LFTTRRSSGAHPGPEQHRVHAFGEVVLREQAAAGGIALINSMAAVGGFVGPYLIGNIKERTGDFTPGLLLLAVSLVAAVVIVLGLRSPSRSSSPTALMARERLTLTP